MSIGGFGYSSESFESNFPHLKPYTEDIDNFYMLGRSIGLNGLNVQ